MKVVINQTTEVINLPLSDLHELQGDLKEFSDAAYENIKDRILEVGFKYLFFYWEDKSGKKFIIDGHHRKKTLERMRDEGAELPEAFPCLKVEASSKKEAAKELLYLNSHYGKMTNAGLKDFLEKFKIKPVEIEKVNIVPINADLKKVADKMLNQENESDDSIPEPAESITKPGDVWSLNGHRIVCGDSTDGAVISELLGERRADVIITDPPYGVSVNEGDEADLKARNRRTDGKMVENDDLTGDNLRAFLAKSFEVCYAYLKKGGSIYVFHSEAMGNDIIFRTTFQDAGFYNAQIIIWKKDIFAFGRQDYHWSHEPIIYGWKKGGSHKFYGEKNQSTVWDCDRPKRSAEHPTMKPVDLITKALENSSKAGDIVFEPFLGSGSTLIGAEKMERICFGTELSPQYVDVVVTRWIKWMQENDRKISLVELNGEQYNYSSIVKEEQE